MVDEGYDRRMQEMKRAEEKGRKARVQTLAREWKISPELTEFILDLERRISDLEKKAR